MSALIQEEMLIAVHRIIHSSSLKLEIFSVIRPGLNKSMSYIIANGDELENTWGNSDWFEKCNECGTASYYEVVINGLTTKYRTSPEAVKAYLEVRE